MASWVGVWLLWGPRDTWTILQIRIQVHKYTNTQIHNYTEAQIHKCTYMQMYRKIMKNTPSRCVAVMGPKGHLAWGKRKVHNSKDEGWYFSNKTKVQIILSYHICVCMYSVNVITVLNLYFLNLMSHYMLSTIAIAPNCNVYMFSVPYNIFIVHFCVIWICCVTTEIAHFIFHPPATWAPFCHPKTHNTTRLWWWCRWWWCWWLSLWPLNR